MFFDDIESGEEMWDNGEALEVRASKPAKSEKKSGCACGRKVCCGKHKNCQCSCKKGKERD